MSDTQMKNVGQTQPAKKPAKDQISSADQRSSPRAPISLREIRKTEQVETNNRITCYIVNFHDGSGWAIQPEIGVRFNKKLFSQFCNEPKPRTHATRMQMTTFRRFCVNVLRLNPLTSYEPCVQERQCTFTRKNCLLADCA